MWVYLFGQPVFVQKEVLALIAIGLIGAVGLIWAAAHQNRNTLKDCVANHRFCVGWIAVGRGVSYPDYKGQDFFTAAARACGEEGVRYIDGFRTTPDTPMHPAKLDEGGLSIGYPTFTQGQFRPDYILLIEISDADAGERLTVGMCRSGYQIVTAPLVQEKAQLVPCVAFDPTEEDMERAMAMMARRTRQLVVRVLRRGCQMLNLGTSEEGEKFLSIV